MAAEKMRKTSSKKQSKKLKLRKNRVVEFIIAVLLTIVLVIAAPVLAWFGNQQRIAKLAKIKAPDELYINAAHREDKIYLDMKSIEVSRKYTEDDQQKSIYSQSFVFSVSGAWVNSYILQMDHTTNNPYTFEIFEGEIYKEVDGVYKNIHTGNAIRDEHENYTERNADGSLKYVEYVATNDFDDAEEEKVSFDPDPDLIHVNAGDLLLVYYGGDDEPGRKVNGRYLNATDGSRIANNTLKIKSYGTSEGGTYSNVNQYVNPKYWQSESISIPGGQKSKPFYQTYVIRVSWPHNDTIYNYNKETDIVYLSAFVN